MSEVQAALEDLTETFRKYRGKRKAELIDLFSQVQCCECGHKKRMRNAIKMGSRPSFRQFDKPHNRLLIACFVFLTVISLYWFHLVRRYNHLKAYGNGACVTTFFYSYVDCELLI